MSKRDKMREALAANLPVRPEKKLESRQEDIILI